jgi:uncharacterized protein (TIGR00162 family)
MQGIETEAVADIDLEDPVLVEGLPGVGHVGKLVAEHVVEEADGELVRRIYAEHFPPQVTVDEGGRTELAHAAIYAVETEGRDLLVLTGDYQAQDAPGHYRLADEFLDVAEEAGVQRVYTLGGVPTGELAESHSVVGAANSDAVVEELTDAGVEFRDEEPAGGIVGSSGLLLGLGERRDLAAACLMGETSGYLVDPKSAQVVLSVLEELLDFEVDVTTLEERADEMEEVMGQIQEMEESAGAPSADDLHYIG